jgi:MFS family permease
VARPALRRPTLDGLGLPAFGYGPFRIYFLANLLSNAGIFVFMASFGWFVQTTTGSAAMVGLASGILGLPWLLLMLHAGLLTDRLGARPLLAVSLAGGGVVMGLVGYVALLPDPSLALVLALAFAMGIVMTVGAPGSVSIVNELVPPAALSSAVSATFLLINVARIIGGAAAGLLLADRGRPVGPSSWRRCCSASRRSSSGACGPRRGRVRRSPPVPSSGRSSRRARTPPATRRSG